MSEILTAYRIGALTASEAALLARRVGIRHYMQIILAAPRPHG
jgi:hypothetical protein